MKFVLFAYRKEKSITGYDFFHDIFQGEQENIVDRPYVNAINDITRVYLNEKMHQFLVERNIKYKMTIEVGVDDFSTRWMLNIPDDNDAMMFKLSWSPK